MVIRANSSAELDGRRPYADAAVRRALALSVDNEICLELGYAGRGSVAANHHVSPIHPAYADIGPAPGGGMTLRALETLHITDALRRNHGNRKAAARELGISFRALRYRIKKLGIE